LDDVSMSLSIVLNGLQSLKQVKPKTSEKDEILDEQKLELLLDRLRQLLEDDDADAADVVEELEKLPGIQAHHRVLKRLLKAIEDYDFELALEELEQLNIN